MNANRRAVSVQVKSGGASSSLSVELWLLTWKGDAKRFGVRNDEGRSALAGGKSLSRFDWLCEAE